MTGPGKRDDELARGGRGRDPGDHGRIAGRARPARGDRAPPRVAASRSCSAPPSPKRARLERVRLVGDDGAGKFGMDAADLVARRPPGRALAASRAARLHAFGASNVLDAGGAGRPRRGDRPRPPGGWRMAVGHRRSGSSTPAAVSASRTRPHEESLDLVAARRRAWRRSPPAGPPTRSCATRDCCSSPVGSWSGRPARTWRASSTARPSTARSWSSSTAASTTSSDRRWSARSTGSGRSRPSRRRAGRPAALVPVTVAGPLCSGLDVFSHGAVMTPPEVGDLVAVLDVGAYGFTESMPLFLSHPIPAEVAVRHGEAALIRPASSPAAGSTTRSCRPGSTAYSRAMLRPRRAPRSDAPPAGAVRPGRVPGSATSGDGPVARRRNRWEALLAAGRPVLADGAMGTMLFSAGLQFGDPPEVWNLSHPDVDPPDPSRLPGLRLDDRHD